VFVLPATEHTDAAIVAQEVGGAEVVGLSGVEGIMGVGRVLAKYLVIVGYLGFVAAFAYGRYCRRKQKKF
jgi:hypothetical protein